MCNKSLTSKVTCADVTKAGCVLKKNKQTNKTIITQQVSSIKQINVPSYTQIQLKVDFHS